MVGTVVVLSRIVGLTTIAICGIRPIMPTIVMPVCQAFTVLTILDGGCQVSYTILTISNIQLKWSSTISILSTILTVCQILIAHSSVVVNQTNLNIFLN